MEAVGAYLKGAREGQGLNPAQVAARMTDILGVSVDATTIWRIERAKMTPRYDLFLAMLAVVRGSAEDVWTLLRSPDASLVEAEERGRAIARLEAARRRADAAETRLRSLMSPAEWERYAAEQERRAIELEDRARRDNGEG